MKTGIWHDAVLTSNRFDLGFKLAYLCGIDGRGEEFGCTNDFLIECYRAHINAFSGGTAKEPDNDGKNCVADFEDAFIAIRNSIDRNGFDESFGRVPVAVDNTILNGAHRTSVCLYGQKKMACEVVEGQKAKFGYEFFRRSGLADRYLDIAATMYAYYAKNIYMAIVWPAAKAQMGKVDCALGDIVYKKRVSCNEPLAKMLLYRSYSKEPWVGGFGDNFKGLAGKEIFCFPEYGEVQVCLFHSKSLDDALDRKEKFRKMCGVGKHSIHITDCKHEVIELAKLVFNNNMINFVKSRSWSDVVGVIRLSEDLERMKLGRRLLIGKDKFSEIKRISSVSNFVEREKLIRKELARAAAEVTSVDSYAYVMGNLCYEKSDLEFSDVLGGDKESRSKRFNIFLFKQYLRARINIVRAVRKLGLYSYLLAVRKFIRRY